MCVFSREATWGRYCNGCAAPATASRSASTAASRASSTRWCAPRAAAHLGFGRKFSAGQARIRAYNPVSGQHGWQSTHTAIEIVSDDMPFLVDSVTMEVNRQGLTLHLLIHPVLRALRDAKGELLSISQPSQTSEGRLESFMHIEADRQTDPAKLAEPEAGIARVLADVRAAVEDWKPMQARMAEIVKRLSPDRYDEERAFLAWLLEDHFA